MFPLIINFKKWESTGCGSRYSREKCLVCKRSLKIPWKSVILYHVCEPDWDNKIEILNDSLWCSPECLTLWLLTMEP
jgi:hypothetical protein